MKAKILIVMITLLPLLGGCSNKKGNSKQKQRKTKKVSSLSKYKKDSGAHKRINSPPVIRSFVITPQHPTAASVIRASVKCYDPNGDQTDKIFVWAINGEVVQEGEEPVLKGKFKKGDVISVKVICSDGENESKPVEESVVVTNSPPEIFLKYQKLEDGVYKAKIEANDPDGDPVHFKIISGPKGMRIDDSGIITWKLPKKAHGKFEVKIKVTDAEGAEAILSYTLKIKRARFK